MPVRITPKVPIYISKDRKTLRETEPTIAPIDVCGEVFAVPVGKGDDYIVFVHGFPDDPGGMLETERLTTGHTVDRIAMTTPEDKELSGLGFTAGEIDGTEYRAVNPPERES